MVFTLVAFGHTAQAALMSAKSSINFAPAISNNTDYFGVYSSQNVKKHGWNTGVYFDWARNPLEFGQPVGTRVANVVGDQLVTNLYATYGFYDWFSMGMNLPLVYGRNVVPLISNGANATFGTNDDNQFNLGDIRFEFKFRVRNNEDRLFGIALLPFVTIPSGDEEKYAGNGYVSGGLKVVLDWNIHERVKLALNLGFIANDRVDILNARISNQVLMSLGLNIKIIKRLHFLLEGETLPYTEGLFDNEVQTPAEIRAGFRIPVTDRWNINVGGGFGLTVGYGSPDWRAFLGANYNWAPEPCAPCAEPIPEREITISQQIHFEFDKAVIQERSYPILNDVANIILQNQDSVSRVLVEGHTDAIGSDAYNQGLSERRANSVREYLINRGVPASKLDSIGFGESNPVATNETAEGRALNRRVQFKVDSN